MLDNKFKQGFHKERLDTVKEPKVQKDARGYFIYTLSENVKVYFDDFYQFLENVWEKCNRELAAINEKIDETDPSYTETLSFLRAKKIVIEQIKKSVLSFYTDGSNFGVVMTPWCFGTVVLEKTELYRERLARGDIQDPNIPEYPYYVIKYMDEIYKKTLLDVFDFPTDAFKMRWQYSELLKRYSKVLSNIAGSLNSVLLMVKNYGS